MDNIIDVGRLWQIIKRNVLLMTLLGDYFRRHCLWYCDVCYAATISGDGGTVS